MKEGKMTLDVKTGIVTKTEEEITHPEFIETTEKDKQLDKLSFLL